MRLRRCSATVFTSLTALPRIFSWRTSAIIYWRFSKASYQNSSLLANFLASFASFSSISLYFSIVHLFRWMALSQIFESYGTLSDCLIILRSIRSNKCSIFPQNKTTINRRLRTISSYFYKKASLSLLTFSWALWRHYDKSMVSFIPTSRILRLIHYCSFKAKMNNLKVMMRWINKNPLTNQSMESKSSIFDASQWSS